MRPGESRPKILYDGSCALCNNTIGFIRRHGGEEQFAFLPMQSQEGQDALELNGYPREYADSVVLIENRENHSGSDAMLRILRRLDAPWSWLARLEVLPRSVRERGYDIVAKNRKRPIIQKLLKRL